MKTCSDYIAAAKQALGDPSMTDRELGARIGYSQQHVSAAKHGRMSDPLALKLADLAGVEAGEVLTVARAQREPDPAVRDALLSYAGKVARHMPQSAGKVALAAVLACGAVSVPSPAQAQPTPYCEGVYIMSTRRRTAANVDQFSRVA